MSRDSHTPGLVVHSTVGYPKPDVVAETGRAVARTWNVCSSQPKTTEQYERRTAEDRANARRIAACWNACNGIPTEDLEHVVEWQAACRSATPTDAHAIEARNPQAIRHFVDRMSEDGDDEEPCEACHRRGCNGECMGDGGMGD